MSFFDFIGIKEAMFKRRKPRSIAEKTRETLWPTMGWKRMSIYLKNRVLRLSDTPRNIALGLAIGAGISFSPIMFTHFIQGGIIAFIMRANIPAALIGTVIGNPWTFPFIWWASITLGAALFSSFGFPAEANIPNDVTLSLLWNMLWNDPMRLFMPWMLGGYLICVIVIAITYPFYLSLIKGAQSARQKVLQRKAHKNAKQVTGQDT